MVVEPVVVAVVKAPVVATEGESYPGCYRTNRLA